MNFHPLDSEHLAATQQVAKELFPWEHEHALALAAAVNSAEHAAFFEARRLASIRCWIARTGCDPVCGLAMLYGYRAQPDEVWLAWFGLLPEARGFGRGAKMLDWLLALVRSEGRHTLRLWTTDEPEYQRATQLYLRRGFVGEQQAALPGEAWKTFVFSFGLDRQPVIPWAEVLDKCELCGREAPSIAAAAA